MIAQAKRLMHNQSASIRGPSAASHLSAAKPHFSATDTSAGNANQRIAALEEELRRVREENEKQVCVPRFVPVTSVSQYSIRNQSAAMQKYKERWDKLKESAKRKKEAKASGSSPVPDQLHEPSSSPQNTPEIRAQLPPRPPPSMSDGIVPRYVPFDAPSISSSPSSHFSESPPIAYGPPGFRDSGPKGLAAGIAAGQQTPVNVVTRRISGNSAAAVGRREDAGPTAGGGRSVHSIGDASLFYSTTSGAGLGFE